MLILGWASLAAAQANFHSATWDKEESLSLTPAREQARQLAITLRNEREFYSATAATVPLGLVVQPPSAPRQRPVVTLFVIQGVEGRVVGGQYTLLSPVAQTSSEAEADAQRPMFVPATQAAIATEVLFE
jgi:hypothetical protein